jgi:hypothetical protein
MGMKSLEQYRADFIDVIKRQLGAAIRAKGGTVNDTDAWSAFVSAVSGIPLNPKKATGTVTSSSTQQNFGGINWYYVTVSVDFGFTPRIIYVYRDGFSISSATIYNSRASGNQGYYLPSGTQFSITSPAYVTSTGFLLPVNAASTVYTWEAFE